MWKCKRYLGTFQLSPRDLHSSSSSGLTTRLSSLTATSVSRGESTDGGRSAGYEGTICGKRASQRGGEQRTTRTLGLCKRQEVAAGAHHGQAREEDVDKVGGAGAGQRPVQLALQSKRHATRSTLSAASVNFNLVNM